MLRETGIEILEKFNIEKGAISKIISKSIEPINEVTLIKRDNDDILIIKSGEKLFEYWISQKKLIPPWKINWYQLKDREYLTLEKDLLYQLVKKAVEKAGNLNKLRKTIKVGATLYQALKKKTETISVKNFRKILFYLNIPYEKFNDKIVEIKKGKRASIKNPKFPINLLRPEAGSLIGALVSDGCISIDRKARMTKRVSYSTSNLEDVEKFIENIKKIFGEVLIYRKRYRNSIVLRIGTSIVADAFLKVGCILGNKTIENKGLPWIILDGNTKMKREYLRVVFSDEGSPGKLHKPYVTLSRVIDINRILNKSHLQILNEFISPEMKTTIIPINYKNREMPIGKFRRLIKNLHNSEASSMLQTIENFIPKLLLDESKLLNEFGIENKIYLRKLSKTSKGEYRATFCIMINRKKSVLKFYKTIGFQSTKKQEKLKEYLKYWGWLC